MPVRHSPAPASQVLAATLCTARERAGLTLEGVAQALRVSRATVWAWEACRSTPCLHDMVALAFLYEWGRFQLGGILYESFPAGCRRPEGR